MKTKIDINYSSLGRTSLLIALFTMMVIFMAWDDANFWLMMVCGITLILCGVGMMAWGCWKIDKMERERDERERTLPRRSW